MRQRLDLPSRLDGDLWHYQNLGRTHALHHHEELELNLVARGTAVYLVSNRRYDLRRGDLLWLFPGQQHVLMEQSLDFEMWIGVFKPKVARKASGDPSARVLRAANPPGDHCRRLSPRAFGRLEALCANLADERDQPALFNSGLAYLLASGWQHYLRSSQMAVPDVHPAVEKATRLIRHESTSLSVDELARKVGLSASRLSRLFKQHTGVALADFRNRQRIEQFLRLQETDRSPKLLECALESGFGSYPQFHRVFKRVIGCSPAEYRRARRASAVARPPSS